MASVKSTPKDAQVMAGILKEMGISDYEPRLLNQMLEFTYRYVSTVLDDAHAFSTHAKKKSIDSEDIKLAINLQEKNSTSAPSRELTADVARLRNGMPLPLIKSSVGLRLPPDRYSLTSCNFRLKSNARKTRTVHTVSRVNVIGTNIPFAKHNLNLLKAETASLIKTSSVPVMPMPRPTVTHAKPMVLKLPNENASNPVSMSSVLSAPIPITISNSQATPQILMPTVGAINTKLNLPLEITGQKRELEKPTPQILMPTVSAIITKMNLPIEIGQKRAHEDDGDYEME